MGAFFKELKASWRLFLTVGLLLAVVAFKTTKIVTLKARLETAELSLSSQKSNWDKERSLLVAEANAKEARFLTIQNKAMLDFTKSFQDKEPIILTATNTVKEYAKTEASSERCLDPEWVQRLARHRSSLFSENSGSTPSSIDSVSTDASTRPE